MNKIYLLTDYKGRFGSKHDDQPYRSGMDLSLLKKCFKEIGYESEPVSFSDVNLCDSLWSGSLVLYTSSEDIGLIYKQYIEDIVLSLSLAGAEVIPRFEFLRANNNKVFMELLRCILPEDMRGNLVSSHYGTLEELTAGKVEIEYPVVVKGFSGAMGRNVFLAHNEKELKKTIRKKVLSESPLRFRIKEYLRQVRHKGYRRDSFYRGRFVVQKFVPGLKNDWKVYFFGNKAFVFYRPIFAERVFRASGGGYDNYLYGRDADIPEGMLDFGWKLFRQLRVPNISMDIAWDGVRFYLLEFQCIYFGTAGILRKYSSEYWLRKNDSWELNDNDGCIEKVYAESIGWFMENEG